MMASSQRSSSSSSNVAKLLFSRELGLPHQNRFNNHSTTTHTTKRQIRKSLIESRPEERQITHDETVFKSILQASMDLPIKTLPQSSPLNDDKLKNYKGDWIRLNFKNVTALQVGIANDLIWTRSRSQFTPTVNPNWTERFYRFTPTNFTFTAVKQDCTIRGRIIKSIIMRNESRDQHHQASTFLVTLTDSNTMCAYDLATNDSITEKIHFSVATSRRPNLHAYTDMSISRETEQIFVLGTSRSGHLDQILIFNYPPNWHFISAIYVNTPTPISLSITDAGICRILNANAQDLCLNYWSFIQQQAYKISPTSNYISTALQLMDEKEITKLPPSQISFSMACRSKCGLVDTGPPMVRNIADFQLRFYSVNPAQPLDMFPVHRLKNQTWRIENGNTNMTPFPDGSSKTLVTHKPIQNSVVVEFEQYTFLAKESKPFYEKGATKHYVLAMDFSEKLNLLAVLLADNPRQFHVALYDQRSMRLFKSFPSITLDPNNYNVMYFVKEASVNLLPEFLLVQFEPNMTAGPNKHIFLCRLLSEKVF